MIPFLVSLLLLRCVYSFDDGTYYIINELSGKPLDCSVTPMTISSSFGTTVQMYEITFQDVHVDGRDRFEVQCVSNGKCWDYRGSDQKIGREGCWSTTNHDQRFKFRLRSGNSYEITGAYDKYLEVSGTSDGSQLTCDSNQETSNDAQHFTVVPADADTRSDLIVVEASKSWTSADEYCESTFGTHLASIHSSEENTIAYVSCNVASTNTGAFDSGCWIGLNDVANSANVFSWTDDSAVDFTNWRSGAPNNAGQTCSFIKLNYDGQNSEWEDTACDFVWSRGNQFLCNAPDITFGFSSCELNYGGSGQPFTVTFYWGYLMYECTVTPSQKSTVYTCDSRDISTNECSAPSSATYGMQISNPSSDSACIDNIRVVIDGATDIANVPDEWVGDDGYYYRYYDLIGPQLSNIPATLYGSQKTSIPTCNTAAHSPGVFHLDTDPNQVTSDWFVITVSKDRLIMLLLLLNALLFIGCIVCGVWMKCKNDQTYKYDKVKAYSSSEV